MAHLPMRVQFTRRDTPFHIGRRSFGAAPSPLRREFFGCLEPSGSLLAPACRVAVRARLKKLGWFPQPDAASDRGAPAAANTTASAVQQGLSPKDLAMVAQDNVYDLP